MIDFTSEGARIVKHMWAYGAVGLLAAAATVSCSAIPGKVEAAKAADAQRSSAVAEQLRAAMDGLRFQEVLDTAPPTEEKARTMVNPVDKEARRLLPFTAADPKPISQQPQMDATIIELDQSGRPVSSGTVLMSPRYKNGVVVPVDRNMSTTSVRWRQWDDAGWYKNKGQGTVDVVPGREGASIDHMLDYPASVMKLMVNFGVLRLVDQGAVKLDDVYEYKPTEESPLCGSASKNTVRKYMDASLTVSSNAASCALIKMLHDRGAIDPLNKTFQDLGLQTLQLKDTRASNGGYWSNAITMSSLDTAKLLTIVNGGPGTLWTAPNGKPVKSDDVLSSTSRRFFRAELGMQVFNDMLSSTNWCGGKYPAAGLPNAAPSRWIGKDGTVTVDGNKFGRDVRPCNKKAEVAFAHKTGWVNSTAGDAGIVRALPGKGGRNYVVVVFSNLGTQYIDANRPKTPTGIYPFSYTEKFAKLGRMMDTYEKSRAARH